MEWNTKRMRLATRIADCLALVALISSLVYVTTPAHAAATTIQQQKLASDTTMLAANFYLPTSALQPLFQDKINQQVPIAVNNAIAGIVSKLPASTQIWAGQMAQTLIQPSATLVSLTPQQDGLATKLRISLYPGDPQPINANMLVTFGVKDASTIQVSAQATKNGPALVNGPLATFHLPVGQLNSIQTTPNCGVAALALGLQLPISLGSSGTSTQQASSVKVQQLSQDVPANATTPAYVEIPASSLAKLGPSIGTIPLNSSMSAQNIRVAIQGTQLVVTSDILLGSLQIGTATTLVTPTAINGNLAVNVTKTTLNVLIMSFQYNTYNQQIQQLINGKLSKALTGKFTVNRAAIGANSSVPCAAGDSLILSGTSSLF
jgi:hypothetical protein